LLQPIPFWFLIQEMQDDKAQEPSIFPSPLFVGRPNLGDIDRLKERFETILANRWFSNNGPFVQEFEQKLAAYTGTKHCIAVCNATIGIELAAQALGLHGQVLVPAYTFVATAHALRWLGIEPVFVDMKADSHNLDPDLIERALTPQTTGIIGTHVWGRPCEVEAIQTIADRHGLKVMYDAAHAFGCSYGGTMLGNFGQCEVFSFHATKFLNSFEGGAIATNNDQLAATLKLMRNFGFEGFDNVVELGTNAKLSEVHAAMGLTSLEAIDEIVANNYDNYNTYRKYLADVTGISVIEFNEAEKNNFQYIVVEVDPGQCPVSRDEIVNFLHTHNVIARRYFWPGAHKMAFYQNLEAKHCYSAPITDEVSSRIIVLPTGQAITRQQIEQICTLIAKLIANAIS
jgi:dTDP-4-amino-4,6-dideoxygalactose transaminase